MSRDPDGALLARAVLCAVGAAVSAVFFVAALLTEDDQPRGPLLVYTGSLAVLLALGAVALVRRLRRASSDER